METLKDISVAIVLLAGHRHNGFLTQHRVFRQHSIEIGAQPVGQVVGLDRSAKPARMKTAGNSVANFDPRYSVSECCDLAGAIGERHHAELRRTATAALSGRSDRGS
jgi:hypothetical protein